MRTKTGYLLTDKGMIVLCPHRLKVVGSDLLLRELWYDGHAAFPNQIFNIIMYTLLNESLEVKGQIKVWNFLS